RGKKYRARCQCEEQLAPLPITKPEIEPETTDGCHCPPPKAKEAAGSSSTTGPRQPPIYFGQLPLTELNFLSRNLYQNGNSVLNFQALNFSMTHLLTIAHEGTPRRVQRGF